MKNTNEHAFGWGTATAQQRAERTLWHAAGIGCVLLFAILITSAYLRLSGAGLGCDPWPQCYGRVPALVSGAGAAMPVASAGEEAARLIHRVAAMLVALIVALVVIVAATGRPVHRHEIATVVALLLLTIFLSVLGRWTTGSSLPAVGLGNMLGGLAMLGLMWWVRLINGAEQAVSGVALRGTRLLAWAALGLFVVQVALGGLTSVKFAALACPSLPGCEGGAWPVVGAGSLFDPFVPLQIDHQGHVIRPPQLAAIHISHRLGALALAIALVWLAVTLGRRRMPKLAFALVGLLALQLLLGALLVVLELPLALVLAHNANAAALLLVLLTAVHRLGRASS
jgi:cytochrome c oxidase assembly protein subunit 15